MAEGTVMYGVFDFGLGDGAEIKAVFPTEELATAHAAALEEAANGMYGVDPVPCFETAPEQVVIYRRQTRLKPTGQIWEDHNQSGPWFAYLLGEDPVHGNFATEHIEEYDASDYSIGIGAGYSIRTRGTGSPNELDARHDARVIAAMNAIRTGEWDITKLPTFRYSGSLANA